MYDAKTYSLKTITPEARWRIFNQCWGRDKREDKQGGKCTGHTCLSTAPEVPRQPRSVFQIKTQHAIPSIAAVMNAQCRKIVIRLWSKISLRYEETLTEHKPCKGFVWCIASTNLSMSVTCTCKSIHMQYTCTGVFAGTNWSLGKRRVKWRLVL